MDIEDKLEPFKKGAEMLLQCAQEATARGDSEKAREFVMKSIRQGLIIRHLKANKKISSEELERIMSAGPEELYQLFAGEEYPKNCRNQEVIRPPVWKGRIKPCDSGGFGVHET